MKKLNRVQLTVALCTSIVCLFFACQLYEPFTEEEVFKGAYERNFVRQFGLVDPLQDWDFTNDHLQCFNKQTRAGEWTASPFVPVNNQGYYEISGDLISKMGHLGFTQKTDKSFALELAENDSIEIYPLYQTSINISYLGWVLQIFADDQNIASSGSSTEGWKMGTGMQVKSSKISLYENIYDKKCTTFGVRSKPIVRYANSTGHSQLLYFNLYVDDYSEPIEVHQKLAPSGTQQSSLNYQMRIVDLPKPADIAARYNVMFIACEAANFDVNNPYDKEMPRYQSLVFMIVGPRLPSVLYLQQDGLNPPYVNHEIESKRYMIEDLGSSSDFDFNDIVLDVTRSGNVPVVIDQAPQKTCNNAIKTTVSLGSCSEPHDYVCVRHLCGTLPFQFQVGVYESAVITDPTDEVQTMKQLAGDEVENATYFEGPRTIEGWSPEATIPVTGWQPEANNIIMRVWRNGQKNVSEGGWQVQFPKVGAVPFVMALPVSVPWSPEGVNFTDWQQFVP